MYLDNDIMTVSISETGARISYLQKGGKNFIFPQQVVAITKDKYAVRGGMHPCSPIFGKKDGQFVAIPQHGGLRDMDWQLDDSVDSAWVEYSCEFKQFGYQLAYKVYYQLIDNCLQVVTRVENKLINPAPFEFGWHPYFFAPKGAEISFPGSKTNRISVSQSYGSEIFKAVRTIQVRLNGVGGVRLQLLQGFADGQVCIWTDWRRRYVCVEPLLSHPDDFNTSKGIFLRQEPLITVLEMYFD